MTQTFLARDAEFAVSTGPNVNDGSGTSTFDVPPLGTRDLVIASGPDADDAVPFRIGDRYVLSFGGRGGTDLTDATVIRSDFRYGAGAVVFEGADPGGNSVQVVWTPDFDLEAWYWVNASGGHSPGFFTGEQNPATCRYVCFTAGTWIETPAGPVPVEGLVSGREVMTEDHGPQPLRWIGKRRMAGTGAAAPVVFAPGALGNPTRLAVSQHHRILIRHPVAELLFDRSEVWVPALSMVNGTTIRIEPQASICYYHLLLDRHEILTANNIPAESLFLGDVALSRFRNERLYEVAAFYPQIADHTGAESMALCRPALSHVEARLFLQGIGRTVSARRGAPDWLVAA